MFLFIGNEAVRYGKAIYFIANFNHISLPLYSKSGIPTSVFISNDSSCAKSVLSEIPWGLGVGNRIFSVRKKTLPTDSSVIQSKKTVSKSIQSKFVNHKNEKGSSSSNRDSSSSRAQSLYFFKPFITHSSLTQQLEPISIFCPIKCLTSLEPYLHSLSSQPFPLSKSSHPYSNNSSEYYALQLVKMFIDKQYCDDLSSLHESCEKQERKRKIEMQFFSRVVFCDKFPLLPTFSLLLLLNMLDGCSGVSDSTPLSASSASRGVHPSPSSYGHMSCASSTLHLFISPYDSFSSAIYCVLVDIIWCIRKGIESKNERERREKEIIREQQQRRTLERAFKRKKSKSKTQSVKGEAETADSHSSEVCLEFDKIDDYFEEKHKESKGGYSNEFDPHTVFEASSSFSKHPKISEEGGRGKETDDGDLKTFQWCEILIDSFPILSKLTRINIVTHCMIKPSAQVQLSPFASLNIAHVLTIGLKIGIPVIFHKENSISSTISSSPSISSIIPQASQQKTTPRIFSMHSKTMDYWYSNQYVPCCECHMMTPRSCLGEVVQSVVRNDSTVSICLSIITSLLSPKLLHSLCEVPRQISFYYAVSVCKGKKRDILRHPRAQNILQSLVAALRRDKILSLNSKHGTQTTHSSSSEPLIKTYSILKYHATVLGLDVRDTKQMGDAFSHSISGLSKRMKPIPYNEDVFCVETLSSVSATKPSSPFVLQFPLLDIYQIISGFISGDTVLSYFAQTLSSLLILQSAIKKGAWQRVVAKDGDMLLFNVVVQELARLVESFNEMLVSRNKLA
ncbi:hypothetical protein ADUPG1_008321 [Aduncisulcus paluster]|uniref:Uncharacterized protein n=1 Tax=Aduncisulcus paluster TaxID=2918883 RepID=A0ABQ5KRJ5_9EUKA|nr:hypothetical protein ADUPG1_008321 [Aduncisulcus paluster]